jgi:putative ABC transport system ATP-binding protein
MSLEDGSVTHVYELSDVSRTFGQGATEVHALDRITARIDPGDFAAVVGPSGSGKTTLLQLLGGLDRPSSGSILFEGRDMVQMGRGELAALRLRAIGFVFQHFNLIPTLTASQNVEVSLAPTPSGRVARRERCAELLEAVGLTARARHLPSQLSGGEQQRVAIARALANDPRVILADEPTGNLDTATGLEILGLLRTLNAQGQTVVLITHDQEIAGSASRTLRLSDGRLLRDAELVA